MSVRSSISLASLKPVPCRAVPCFSLVFPHVLYAHQVSVPTRFLIEVRASSIDGHRVYAQC